MTLKHDSPSLPLCNGCAHPLSISSRPSSSRLFSPPALPEQGLSSVIKYPWSGRNQPWMFITLGQRVLMEKLLQSMSSPQGNRVVDRKQQYLFILSRQQFLCSFSLRQKQEKSYSITKLITFFSLYNLFDCVNLKIDKANLCLVSSFHAPLCQLQFIWQQQKIS